MIEIEPGLLIDIHAPREQVEAMRQGDATRMAESALSVLEAPAELRRALHPSLQKTIAAWWAEHFCSIDDLDAKLTNRRGS